MMIDPFGTQLSTTSARAAAGFTSATELILKHRPGVDAALADALNADPHCVGAHALRGLCQVTLARADTIVIARRYLRDAEDALALTASATRCESALLQGLRFAVHGGLRGAAEIFEAHLQTSAEAILFAKLAQALRFMAGDTASLSTGVDHALAACTPSVPAYGFLLGCRAFALEEMGAFDAAARVGHLAIEMEPEDAWAIHTLAHIHEMRGTSRDGLAWIEAQRPVWSRCNNFAQHMSWHGALFHLERGDGAAALDLYDREIWPRASDDFRDVSNAVGLLHRLESSGVAVGARWVAIADVAARHRHDVTLVFASLHHLLALLGAHRLSDAADLLESLERPALPGNDQERVARLAGRGLARLLMDAAQGSPQRHDLSGLLAHLPVVGGSGAQRDLFLRALAEIAAARADEDGLAQVLAVRHRLKCEDRFASVMTTRCDAGLRHSRRIA